MSNSAFPSDTFVTLRRLAPHTVQGVLAKGVVRGDTPSQQDWIDITLSNITALGFCSQWSDKFPSGMKETVLSRPSFQRYAIGDDMFTKDMLHTTISWPRDRVFIGKKPAAFVEGLKVSLRAGGSSTLARGVITTPPDGCEFVDGYSYVLVNFVASRARTVQVESSWPAPVQAFYQQEGRDVLTVGSTSLLRNQDLRPTPSVSRPRSDANVQKTPFVKRAKHSSVGKAATKVAVKKKKQYVLTIESNDVVSNRASIDASITYFGVPVPPKLASELLQCAEGLQRLLTTDAAAIQKQWTPEELLKESVETLRDAAVVNGLGRMSKSSKSNIVTKLLKRRRTFLVGRGINNEQVLQQLFDECAHDLNIDRIDEAIPRALVRLFCNKNDRSPLLVFGLGGTGKSTIGDLAAAIAQQIGLYALRSGPTHISAYRVNGKTFATILRVVPSELAPLAEAIIQCKDADFSEQCDWPHVEDEVRLLAEILKTRHDSQSHLRSANLFLILDEVFYTCCGVILVLDCLLRQFHDPSAVFGGVQSILMGDGTQFPPVKTKTSIASCEYLLRKFFNPDNGCVRLTELRRQGPCAVSASVVSHISLAINTYRVREAMASRVIGRTNTIEGLRGLFKLVQHNYGSMPPVMVTHLKTKFENGLVSYFGAQEVNALLRQEISAEEFKFIASDSPPGVIIDETCQVLPKEATFRVGSVVMFVHVYESLSGRVLPGTFGRVLSLTELQIHVEVDRTKEIICVRRVLVATDACVRKSKRSMFGIIEAHALCVHRFQSIEVKAAVLCVDTSFDVAQVAVAIGRVQSLANTFIIGCGPPSLQDSINVVHRIWSNIKVPEQHRVVERYFGYDPLQPVPFPEGRE